MKFFKKLFDKKKIELSLCKKRGDLTLCNNVTHNTEDRNIIKAENTLRLIDLVQEPGIAKEIFEMQHENKIYIISCRFYDLNKHNFVVLQYGGYTFNDVFKKFKESVGKGYELKSLTTFAGFSQNDYDKVINAVKYNLIENRKYIWNASASSVFTFRCYLKVEII